MPAEPTRTALFVVAIGVLVLLSALSSRASGRLGVPLALVFLVIGMAAGSDGIGGIPFEDYALTFRLGTIALALILFDGGLHTETSSVRLAVRPAAVLATFGVVLTAVVVALCAWLLGEPRAEALLLGAIVASTDAAAVFSVLRGSGIQLQRRVGVTLELESGLNDPMAIILTFAITEAVVTGEPLRWTLALDVALQLVVGAAFGLVTGVLGALLLSRVRLIAGGLYPAVTLALALLAFGGATLLSGSGFLAVYLAGLALGAREDLPYRNAVLRVHDAAAWLSQIGMFLLLGLLVSPTRLVDVAGLGLALGLLLAVFARPVAVLLCLLPFRYPWREQLYISWVGLRGAVPIILATYPVMAGAPFAERVFDLVFFVVVVNALVPGSTVAKVTEKLGLRSEAPPPAPAVLDINSTQRLSGRVLAFFIDRASAAAGARIDELPLPPGASIMVVVRGNQLLPARGAVVLQPGDHIYVISRPEDEGLVHLLLGRREA